MTDVTALLEREERHYELPPGALDRLADRRDRRRRTRQITALAFTLLLLAVAIGGAILAIRSAERRVPANPEPGALEAAPLGSFTFGGLTVDGEGAVWWRGPGLSRFDPATGSLRTFTAADDPGFQDILPVYPARDGGVWTRPNYAHCSERGIPESSCNEIWRFDGEGFRETLGPSPVWDVAQSPDGTIWGSSEGGLFRWNGASWDWVSSSAADRPIEDAWGVTVDRNGGVWVINERSEPETHLGVSRFDGSTWTTWTTSNGLPSNEVYTIVPGPGGEVWVGTSDGVARFLDGSWTPYPRAETGIEDVFSIAATEDGVWIAGGTNARHQIARFDGTTWITDAEDGLETIGVRHSYIQFAGGPSGAWASTNAGLFDYDGARWELRVASTGAGPGQDVADLAAAGADEVWALVEDNVGLGLPNGAWRLVGDTWSFFGEGTAPWHRVSDVAIAPDGTPWAATDQGVMSFDGSDWTTVEPGVYSKIVFGPDGSVWTVSGEWSDWRIQQVGGTTLPGPGQLEWGVSSLAVDQSAGVWAGSAGWRYSGRAAAGGLVRFDGEGWQEMEPVAGVDEFLVQDIEATADGELWVSVLCLNHDLAPVVARYRDGAWTTFRDAEGRPFVGALEGDGPFGQLDSTPDGDVLLTTSGGVVAFRDGAWTSVQEGTFRLLSVAPDGTVWLAGDGLFRIPGS